MSPAGEPPSSSTSNPETYLEMIRADVPRYDELQAGPSRRSRLRPARVLELGIGTGETTRRLLERFPDAQVTGLDSTPEMVFRARELGIDDAARHGWRTRSRTAPGIWSSRSSSSTTSTPSGKRDLFRRVREQSRALVIGDVVEVEPSPDRLARAGGRLPSPAARAGRMVRRRGRLGGRRPGRDPGRLPGAPINEGPTVTPRRRALVTGAARGIGAAAAERLRRDGLEVVTADRDEGCDLRFDVASGELPELGEIDVCVSNAAVTDTIAPAHRMTAEQWNLDIAVNLTGAFRVIQAVAGDARAAATGGSSSSPRAPRRSASRPRPPTPPRRRACSG